MSTRSGAILLAILAAAHVVLFAQLDALPFLDLPNHLARATILGDLWFDGGRRYGDAFAGELLFVPYVLGDLVLASLTRWLPPDVAGRLWVVALFLALPAAVLYCLRAFGYRGWQLWIAVAVAVFLSTDWFFVVGFTAFRLGLAVAVAGLGAWRVAARPDASPAAYGLYAALVASTWLAHLAPFVMLGVAAALLTAHELHGRRIGFGRAVLLGVPFVALAVAYLATGAGETSGATIWGTAARKVARLGAEFVRYDARVDLALLAVVFAALAPLAVRRRRLDATAIAFGALAIAFVALYFALPVGRGTTYDVDLRALPFAALFAVFALARGADPARAPTWSVALLALALVGNVAYLRAFLVPLNAQAREYRAAVQALPRGTAFLPVCTAPPVGRVPPLVHAFAWATIDREAVAPYLFSADRRDAMIYFRYRKRGVEPYIFWYVRDAGVTPDWRRVAADYPYVVVTTPFDPRRIGLTGTWSHDRAAAILEVTGARDAAAAIAPPAVGVTRH